MSDPKMPALGYTMLVVWLFAVGWFLTGLPSMRRPEPATPIVARLKFGPTEDVLETVSVIGQQEFATVHVNGMKVSVVAAREAGTGRLLLWHSRSFGSVKPDVVEVLLDSAPIAPGAQLGDCCGKDDQ